MVGTAAILASYLEESLPLLATRSEEADLAPFGDADGSLAMAIEGAIGQGNPFHDSFGYYADGVDFRTAVAPDGWRDRLVPFAPPGSEPGRGMCLEPHDLAAAKLVAKLAAGRIKDMEFVGALLDAALSDAATLAERIDQLPRERVPPAYGAKVRRFVASWRDANR